jgi:CSLREA domain-containing protein
MRHMTRTTSYLLRPLVLLMLAALAASVVAMVLASPPAQAANFTVTTAADEQNTNAQCSLREAIINANQNNQSGSADCPAGVGEDTINFNLVSPATITLASQLPITDSAELTIDSGSANITVSGNRNGSFVNGVRVFQVDSGAKLTLNNLTVANGNAAVPGSAGEGGGIHNSGTLTVSNSTISDNLAGLGGGIYNQPSGTLTVSNSTISGNSANFVGGIYNQGTLTVNNSTISSNTAFIEIGGIYGSPNTTTTLKNTIVANNTEGSPKGENCFGNITNGGYNLDSGTSCGFGTANNSLSSTDPKLGILADNGGPTKTHALQASSPARDKGVEVAGITTDQRGVARPQGAAPDIGAFEFVDTIKPTVIDLLPAAGATDISRGANVVATFSEKMEKSTLTNPANFKLFKRTATGTYIRITDVTLTTNVTGTKATLNPFGDSDTRLARNIRYKAVVTTGVKDLIGNAMAANKVWTFKTVS